MWKMIQKAFANPFVRHTLQTIVLISLVRGGYLKPEEAVQINNASNAAQAVTVQQ